MYEKLCKNSTLCAGIFVDYGSLHSFCPRGKRGSKRKLIRSFALLVPLAVKLKNRSFKIEEVVV